MRLTHVGMIAVAALVLGTTGYAVAFTGVTTLEHALTDAAIRENNRPTGGATDSTVVDVWFFFRAADCHIGSHKIGELNHLHDLGFRIHGVLLDPPVLHDETARMISDYSARFAIVADSDGYWHKMLQRGRFVTPLYAVVKGAHLVGALSPSNTIAELLVPNEAVVPSGTLDEKGRDIPLPRRLLAVLRDPNSIAAFAREDLRKPELMAADASHVFVFDYGDMLLKAFDFAGNTVWRYGIARRGDMTFLNPTDVRITDSGGIAVYDAARKSVVSFSRAGVLVTQTALARDVTQVVPVEHAGLWALGAQIGQTFGFDLDTIGNVVARLELPDTLAAIDPIARQPVVAISPDENVLIAGFRNEGGFVVWRRTAKWVPSSVNGIESVAGAAVTAWHMGNALVKHLAPNATNGSVALTADRDNFFVLFHGSTSYARRLVDVYRIADGTYRGSYVLPYQAMAITRARDGFVVLRGGDAPSFSFLRIPSMSLRTLPRSGH